MDFVVVVVFMLRNFLRQRSTILITHSPLNLVAIGPSPDSCIRKLAEFVLVTSMPMKFGGSGGLVWSHPKSIRRNPLMRRSHIPICLSVSVPVQLDTDGPAYAVPVKKTKKHMQSVNFRQLMKYTRMRLISISLFMSQCWCISIDDAMIEWFICHFLFSFFPLKVYTKFNEYFDILTMIENRKCIEIGVVTLLVRWMKMESNNCIGCLIFTHNNLKSKWFIYRMCHQTTMTSLRASSYLIFDAIP